MRQLAAAHQLPAELRARLVLSVSLLAGQQTAAGRAVTLRTTYGSGPQEATTSLAVTLHCPGSPAPLALPDLPLPVQSVSRSTATWRIPLTDPAQQPGASIASRHSRGDHLAAAMEDDDAAEEELRAALARADAFEAEHRRLKHELAETNSGVLALYIQLEERDEQIRKAHGRILQELEDALRPQPIKVDGLELAVHYEPADTGAPTGGDLYDWFALPDGTVHITVVDALGHGITSTRSALNVTHAVRTLALEGHPLQSIVARTDEILMPLDRDLMATVLLARLNPSTGELQLANGSHPPALLVRTDHTCEYLEARGRGIGYPLPGSDGLHHARLNPGDLLLLYTDGLTESRRNPLEGEARLRASARRHLDKPIADIPGAIADDMLTVVLHPDDTLALTARITRPPRQHPPT
ncbi:PP2C family protein-serine/threonine phosphatase [Streptomyces sp. NBC_01180]|uniref:PP2C family protein-serine/threonine phosphatase n=1 Tax=Streptomyces sp. NBC_01180 TaxID=2903763 RepID=UPI003862FF6B|nr:serine/threonine-protein phosphatase [Streptomyces sp. NBC_01180]